MTSNPDDIRGPNTRVADPPSKEFRRGLIETLPALRRFALTLCRNTHARDDLVQATCERALGRWQQFTPNTRMESWLFAVMHSIWKNDLRKAGNQRRAYGKLKLAVNQTDGEREILGKIELSEVLLALKEISINQAAAITLVSLEGLFYREAAEILEIPQGTLESRIARGRIALGRALEDGQTVAARKTGTELKSRSLP